MKRLGCLLSLAMCLCAAGQSVNPHVRQARPSQAPANGPASIAGTVINSVTGEPLESVHVRLERGGYDQTPTAPPTPYGAMTDSAGHFSITALTPSDYSISLERRGFVMVRGRQGSVGASGGIELKPGEQVQDVTLAMAPEAILAGRIVDEYGDPIMNVFVKPIPVAPWKILDSWERLVITNDRGEFRVIVQPGKYYILAGTMPLPDERSQRSRDPANTAESNYLETYYPSATTTVAAVAVEAKPGRETGGLEMRLARTPALGMSGVLMGTLDCISQPSIVAKSDDDRSDETGNPSSVSLDASDNKSDYKFRFARLAPGLYRVRAECSAGDHILRSQVVEVALTDSNIENLSLALAQGPDIKDLSGKVEWTASSLRSPERKNSRTVRLMEVGAFGNAFGNPFGNPLYTADVAPDGTFTLKDVLPDRYGVQIYPLPESGCIMAIQLGGTQVRNGVLDLTDGAEGAELKITLSAKGSQVTGWVVENAEETPSSFGTVVIYQDQGETVPFDGWPAAPLSPRGGYGFGGLRPGKYRLLATRRTFSSLYEVHEFIKQHRGSAVIIEIKKEGDKISKDLQMSDEDPR